MARFGRRRGLIRIATHDRIRWLDDEGPGAQQSHGPAGVSDPTGSFHFVKCRWIRVRRRPGPARAPSPGWSDGGRGGFAATVRGESVDERLEVLVTDSPVAGVAACAEFQDTAAAEAEPLRIHRVTVLGWQSLRRVLVAVVRRAISATGCRVHGGKGSPCDFVSIHAYDRSDMMAAKLTRQGDRPGDRSGILSESLGQLPRVVPRLDAPARRGGGRLLYSTRPIVAHLQTSGTYESSALPSRPCVLWTDPPGTDRSQP